MRWYEPDEDSYTFLDVLEKENIRNKIIVDLGTSTGVLSEALRGNIVIGVDLNKEALVEQKRRRQQERRDGFNLVRGDLLSTINQKAIELIVFNPPYVVDSHDPIIGGGVMGREVINRFIQQVEVRAFYLLIIKANRPEEVIEKIKAKGYSTIIMKIRRILGETIIILKAFKEVPR